MATSRSGIQVSGSDGSADPQAIAKDKCTLWKNRLQELAQRNNLDLPLYETTPSVPNYLSCICAKVGVSTHYNMSRYIHFWMCRYTHFCTNTRQVIWDGGSISKGHPHQPEFTSTVVVCGKQFQSHKWHSRRKDAQQCAAEVAYRSLVDDPTDVHALIDQGVVSCQSILNEFAVKTKATEPTYYVRSEGLAPMTVFVSSVVFAGNTYTGEAATKKKDAKQKAARVAIKSILASNKCMKEFIRSKKEQIIVITTGFNKDMCNPPTNGITTFAPIIFVPAFGPACPTAGRVIIIPAAHQPVHAMSNKRKRLNGGVVSCQSILNEFAVKTKATEPTYYVRSEGLAPMAVFVSSVVFAGNTYTGEAATKKKDAKQKAARVAIKSILASNKGMKEFIRSKKEQIIAITTGFNKDMCNPPTNGITTFAPIIFVPAFGPACPTAERVIIIPAAHQPVHAMSNKRKRLNGVGVEV